MSIQRICLVGVTAVFTVFGCGNQSKEAPAAPDSKSASASKAAPGKTPAPKAPATKAGAPAATPVTPVPAMKLPKLDPKAIGLVGLAPTGGETGESGAAAKAPLTVKGFKLVGACSKPQVETKVQAKLAAFRGCVGADRAALANAQLSLVAPASGPVEARIEGATSAPISACLTKVMKQIAVEKTGDGICMVKWRLR